MVVGWAADVTAGCIDLYLHAFWSPIREKLICFLENVYCILYLVISIINEQTLPLLGLHYRPIQTLLFGLVGSVGIFQPLVDIYSAFYIIWYKINNKNEMLKFFSKFQKLADKLWNTQNLCRDFCYVSTCRGVLYFYHQETNPKFNK